MMYLSTDRREGNGEDDDEDENKYKDKTSSVDENKGSRDNDERKTKVTTQIVHGKTSNDIFNKRHKNIECNPKQNIINPGPKSEKVGQQRNEDVRNTGDGREGLYGTTNVEEEETKSNEERNKNKQRLKKVIQMFTQLLGVSMPEHGVSEVQTGVSTMLADVCKGRTGISTMRAEVSEVRTGVSTMRAEVSEVRSGVSTMRDEVSEVRTGVSTMRAEVSEVRSGVSTMRAEVSEVRTGVSTMRDEVSEVRTEVQSVSSDLQTLLNRVAENNAPWTDCTKCYIKNCQCPYHGGRAHKKKDRRNHRRHSGYTATGGADGGDSSGDDSSSETDTGQDDKPGPAKFSDRRTKRWIVDSEKDLELWGKALATKDKESVDELLRLGKLPTRDHIKQSVNVFGPRSDVTSKILDKICEWIKSKHTEICSVEPAYKSGSDNDVVFIVNVEDIGFQLDLQGIDFIVRGIKQYSPEGAHIVSIEKDENHRFTKEELSHLTHCLGKNSDALMKKHSNLQMISSSPIKSKCYGHELSQQERRMCIVFYVPLKGYIPWFEEPLPRILDGIPTDVREGGFEFLANANDRHSKLKMGCEIAGDIKASGTLGPFFEQDGNIYCLTAAHIIYGTAPSSDEQYEWPALKTGSLHRVNVYQPNHGGSEWKQDPFGCVWSAVYKKGHGQEPGIDVAVVLIEDKARLPISGEFPDPVEGSPMEGEASNTADNSDCPPQSMVYNSGLVCERDFFDNNPYNNVKISKFGSTTGESHGFIKMSGTGVRRKRVTTGDGKTTILLNQIELQLEADYGDSGALILAAYGGNMNDLRAIGLLIGRSTTGTTLATPMYAILNHLRLNNREFMKFPQIHQSISVDSGIGPAIPIGDIQDRQEQEQAQEIARHITEVKQNLSKELSDDLNKKLDDMKETYFVPRFEAIEQATRDTNTRTDTLNAKVDNVNSKVDNVDSKVDNLNTKFDSMSNQLGQMMQIMLGNMSQPPRTSNTDDQQNSL